MIIFLHGPDSYRRKQKLKEIVAEYKKKHQSIGFFDLQGKNSEAEFNRFYEFCASDSLFDDVKLAVVENLFDYAKELSAKEQKNIIEFIKSNLENKNLTILIFEEKLPLKAFDFLLKKPVMAQGFKNLTAGQMEFFIKKEAEKRRIKLSGDAVIFLAHAFSEDVWGLINELEKLSLFDDNNFNADRLKAIIDYDKPIIGNEFFRRVGDLIFSRFTAEKIVNLEILLNREEPAKIFNFLASFSSNPPQTIRRFADYDIAVKSGKMDYEEVLVDFAINGN